MLQKIHQNIASELIVRGVKRPSSIDFGDLFDEGIVGPLQIQGKGIDRDVRFGAADDFRHGQAQRLRQRRIIELRLAPAIDVGRGLTIGDHNDLF